MPKQKIYGAEGRQSLDPVVFFKILLVGYLNNINSDRALPRYCSNCLDMRLFLGDDSNEELPRHSTLSRTRQLLDEEVFLELFRKILSKCVEKGMVRGKRQAMDSVHKPLYDAMRQKLNRNKNYTRLLTKRRSSTVEPVLGALINYHGMKRINTRGMKAANKRALMAALAYNLKKLLKFNPKKIKGNTQILNVPEGKFGFIKNVLLLIEISLLSVIQKCSYFSPLLN